MQVCPEPRREVVRRVQRHGVEADRDGERACRHRVIDVNARLLQRERDDVEPTTDGGETRPDEEVRVAEPERALTESVQHLTEGRDEVTPPHADRHGDARDRDQDDTAPVERPLTVTENLLVNANEPIAVATCP